MWKEALDNGLKVHVGVLFIDFGKAFECVNHIILGEKRKALVVSEDMWMWLMDYLEVAVALQLILDELQTWCQMNR